MSGLVEKMRARLGQPPKYVPEPPRYEALRWAERPYPRAPIWDAALARRRYARALQWLIEHEDQHQIDFDRDYGIAANANEEHNINGGDGVTVYNIERYLVLVDTDPDEDPVEVAATFATKEEIERFGASLDDLEVAYIIDLDTGIELPFTTEAYRRRFVIGE